MTNKLLENTLNIKKPNYRSQEYFGKSNNKNLIFLLFKEYELFKYFKTKKCSLNYFRNKHIQLQFILNAVITPLFIVDNMKIK